MIFRYINITVWSKAGHLSKALSKGPKTTTWIWNLHSEAHDFDMHQSSIAVIRRKGFSSNLAHLSLVFFWISSIHFHGAYFSNYDIWLKDPKHYLPSAQLVWSQAFGQDILNSDIGNSFQGIHITSGIFQLWRSIGIVSLVHLKYACSASLIGTIISIGGSYFTMHISPSTLTSAGGFYVKFKSLSIHHTNLLFGLSSISWCGHQIHISVPTNTLLDSGIDPVLICSPQDLLFKDLYEIILPGFSEAPLVFSLYIASYGLGLWPHAKGISILGSTGKFFNSSTGSVFLGQVRAHHACIGIVFILGSVIGFHTSEYGLKGVTPHLSKNPWHAQLSINLAIGGSFSITFAHHIYSIPIYPYCASDYPTVLCLFYHHIFIGGFLIIGAGAHASIFMIGDYSRSYCINFIHSLKAHRDLIIGHLIWVILALGFHSFSLYIHNDTLQAFGRPEDIFHDNSIILNPVFASSVQSFISFDIKILDKKI